jgi:hypothetical protein
MTEIKMALSKKHYEQFAQIIAAEVADIPSHMRHVEEQVSAQIALKRVASRMAVHFKVDNPRFDRARFLAACGFEG